MFQPPVSRWNGVRWMVLNTAVRLTAFQNRRSAALAPSRVELFLPQEVSVSVQPGQNVKGGETVMGYFP